MQMKRFALLLAVLLTLVGTMATAQTLTGTIEGTVTDEQGGVLPGVSVTLTGRQGTQTTVTDERGGYRFVGLNPGVYEVKSELSGFTPLTERNLDLGIGKTLTVPFTMRVGGLTENVEVVANASTIDTTSAATDNSLSQDLLANMPLNLGTFNAAAELLNYTPGINNGAAFGGDEDYGSALMIDGVDTRDPEGGSAWVFYNYNIIDEVQVGGLGAPAEYGGFTGAVVNTITKSGGNLYSGLFEVRHTNDGLAGDNVSEEYLEENPALGSPDVLTKLWDYTVQLGGPFVKDKAFWWMSVQRFAFDRDPNGPRTKSTEVSPRYNAKVTFQLTPSDSLNASFQYDNYNVTGRLGYVPAAEASDDQTLNQDSPEAVWNVNYRKIFGSSSFFEAKYAGYWGYYYLDPVTQEPYRFDLGTGANSGGAGYFGYYDRDRNQVNVSLATYADKFGQHNFKFGMEIERSSARNRSGLSGGFYYADYYGVPYYAYTYYYDVEGKNRRESYYAQDNWKIGNRLTVNLGLRLDHISGYSPVLDETVYKPELMWGPRLGVAFDLTGRGTSVFKATWDRLYEGAGFNPFNNAVGGWTPFETYFVYSPGDLELIDSTVIGGDWIVDDEIKHFGLTQTTVAFEQQLRRDMRFAVTGIWREWNNFVGAIIPGSTWTPFTRTNPLTNQPYTAYRWASRATTQPSEVTNYEGFRYVDPSGNLLGIADPYREYKGVMFVLTKSWSNRWQGQFSYVWSETEGSVANSGRSGNFGGGAFRNPNLGLTNAAGTLENDRTHELKLMGGYQVPRIEVALNAYYRALSGRTYTPVQLVSGSPSVLNWTGSLNILLEPRGSRRYETEHVVDFRAEKVFNVGIHRFGIFMDVANLFNNDTVVAVQTRVPSRDILGNTVLFEAPTGLVGARQLTFGGRWSFEAGAARR
jgi:hypothetical protein